MPILGVVASSTTGASLGSFYSIDTKTVGAGGASSVLFSSIPSTYQHLQIRGIVRDTSTSGSLRFKLNGDTGNYYARHVLYGVGSGTPSASGTFGDNIAVVGDTPISTWSANMYGAFIFDILDYASTNKYKTVKSFSARDDNGAGSAYVELRSNLYAPPTTTAITSVEIFFPSSNIAVNSHFALYGIKGA